MERLKQLMKYREVLANEERSLKEARKIIQKQINALDIERLHLESTAKRPDKKNIDLTDINTAHEHDDDQLKQLDLDVPNRIINYEEEDEDDEDL